MSVAAVILAAGASSRLGRPKQTVVIGNETLLNRAVRVAVEAGLCPVIAVIADPTLRGSIEQQGGIALRNDNASKGMASSIRVGVAYVRELSLPGVVVMTCDQPGVQPEHLRGLMAERDVLCASGYGARKGVPAYFPAAMFDALLSLEGDTGARELLRDACVVTAEGLGIDIDTEGDVLKARELFEHDARKQMRRSAR